MRLLILLIAITCFGCEQTTSQTPKKVDTVKRCDLTQEQVMVLVQNAYFNGVNNGQQQCIGNQIGWRDKWTSDSLTMAKDFAPLFH